MSFLKAAKPIPEYYVYLEALLKYKEECKRYKRLSAQLKNATEPLEKLAFFEAKERYSKACKVFGTEREMYVRALAKARLAAKANSLGSMRDKDIEAALFASVPIPLSLADIQRHQKEQAIRESIPDAEFERLRAIAMQHPSMKGTAAKPLDSASAQDAVQSEKDVKNTENVVIEDSSFGEDEENPFGPA